MELRFQPFERIKFGFNLIYRGRVVDHNNVGSALADFELVGKERFFRFVVFEV